MSGFSTIGFAPGFATSLDIGTTWYSVLIGGIDYSEFVKWDSLNIDRELGSRAVSSIFLEDPGVRSDSIMLPLISFDIGDPIIVTDVTGSDRIFGGTVDSIDETRPLDGSYHRLIQIRGVSFDQIADRHLVAAVYENKTLLEIVTDVNNTALFGEDLTLNVVTGPTLSKVVFPYLTATDVFNELSTITGYSWWIDEYKILNFVPREFILAPWNISQESYFIQSLSLSKSRDQYRNRQYIRAGVSLTSLRTESFKGDGIRKTFNVSFPVGLVPEFKVNTVTKLPGIKGVETGKDWYWNKGQAEVSQDDAGVALTTSDTLTVTYQGLFPTLVTAQNDLEIQTRSAAEGGTGVYESIEDDQVIDTSSIALDKANAYLQRFSRLPESVSFWTFKSGLKPGQLIQIDDLGFGLAGNYLIQGVNIVGEIGVGFRYTVKAIKGEAVGGWIKFFQDLVASRRTFVIRENEVLLTLRTYNDEVTVTDFVSYVSGAGESRVGTALVGYSEIG